MKEQKSITVVSNSCVERHFFARIKKRFRLKTQIDSLDTLLETIQYLSAYSGKQPAHWLDERIFVSPIRTRIAPLSFEGVYGNQKGLLLYLCQRIVNQRELLTERLSKKELEGAIGKGRNSVNSALLQLKQKGLVYTQGQVGRKGGTVYQIEPTIYRQFLQFEQERYVLACIRELFKNPNMSKRQLIQSLSMVDEGKQP